MVIVTTFHIDRARELIINNTNSVKDVLLDCLQAISAKLQTVGTGVTALTCTVPDPEHASSSTTQTKFEVIERSLEALHQKVDKLTSLAGGNPSLPQVSPNSSTTLPPGASQNLPAFQAVHPTASCRTYGTIMFDGASSRIPMDILGRPASTTLRLDMTVAASSLATSVSYKIFDDDYLLLSENVETAHKLQHCPSDCLALLHQRCPNFVYKIRSHGLC
uniref:TGB3 n=1 Tax=Garlic virus E TaxID=150285 RepID=A0A6M2YWK9_9VIRU|nr:TGB3 [Garlic virus E]